MNVPLQSNIFNTPLRWFPVRAAHSQEFVYVFCFVSCKTSQNVNILQLLTWRIFKIKINRHYGYKAVEAHCFVLSHITSWNNFTAVKINEAAGKRIWKVSKDKVCGSQRITSIRIPSSEPFIMFIYIRVLRLRSTDWKSSLSCVQIGLDTKNRYFLRYLEDFQNIWKF